MEQPERRNKVTIFNRLQIRQDIDKQVQFSMEKPRFPKMRNLLTKAQSKLCVALGFRFLVKTVIGIGCQTTRGPVAKIEINQEYFQCTEYLQYNYLLFL